MNIFKNFLLILLLTAFGFVGYQYFNFPSRVKLTIEREATISLGARVEVNKVKINFIKGQINIRGIKVYNPTDDFVTDNLFDIDRIFTKFSPISFFRNEIILDEVVIYSPRISLDYNAAKISNFDIIHTNALNAKPSRQGKYFLIRDLEVRDLEIIRTNNRLSKATDIEEIIMKNIGAHESGLTYSRLTIALLDIFAKKGIEAYGRPSPSYVPAVPAAPSTSATHDSSVVPSSHRTMDEDMLIYSNPKNQVNQATQKAAEVAQQAEGGNKRAPALNPTAPAAPLKVIENKPATSIAPDIKEEASNIVDPKAIIKHSKQQVERAQHNLMGDNKEKGVSKPQKDATTFDKDYDDVPQSEKNKSLESYDDFFSE